MDIKILRGLCEAYNGVYTPQELTEEQIWEEVENWVNSLIEEGYDLSDYSWEDMYEAYLKEAPNWAARQELNRLQRGAKGLGKIGTSLLKQAAAPVLGAYTVLNTKAQQAGAKDFERRSGGVRPGELYRASDVGPDGKPKAGATPQIKNIETAVRGGPQQPPRPATDSPGSQQPPRPATDSPGSQQPSRPSRPSRPATPAPAAAKPAASPVAQPKPTTPAPGTKAAGPESIKPKTPNPLLAGGDIRRMQQASQMRQKGIDITSDQIAAAERTKPTTAKKESTEWGSTSKLVDDIANLYQSVYEAKKVDQDEDGDNDFADVRIARLIASGMSKEEAIAKVKNKPYNEEFVTEDPVQDFRDMRRSKENAAGMRGPELSHSAKPAGSAKQKPQKPEPRSREFSHGGTTKLTGPSSPGYDTRRLGGYDLRRLANSYEFEGNNVDEATRMRKELGKEGEIATRKELARRSKSFKRSDAVDKTIAAAERGADRTTARNRDESEGDYKTRMQKRSQTLRGLAANRRKSVRSGEGLRGYAAKVTGGDRDLQSARGSARSAGTLTNRERKQFGEEFDLWIEALIEEGYDLSEYTWNEMYEMYEIYEETAKEKEDRLEARRARVKELQSQGREMTSSKRAKQRAEQRKEEQRRDKVERLGGELLNQLQGNSGKVSDKPMGSDGPVEKEDAPEATRRLHRGLKRDTLGTAADQVLKQIRNEQIESWVNELIEEGYDLSIWSDKEIIDLYTKIFD